MAGTNYEPDVPITISPLFAWPPRPGELLAVNARALVAPLLIFYALLSVAIWYLLTPSLASMQTLRPGWILTVWARNLVLLTLWAGGLHYFLHRRRTQGDRLKYTDRPFSHSRTFTANNQVIDNMIWSLGSGVTIWSLYECATWWIMANNPRLVRSWTDDWLYLGALVVAMVFWSQLHFYLNHRLLHVEPLYRLAHKVHHRNPNTGPWSGISMHPLEHLLYFSAPVLLWVVPSHPVVVLMLLLYSGISPAASHCGFDRVEVFGRWSFGAGDYYHHLHHRYFECNYGNRLVPLDALFGTFHDGTTESHRRMRARRRAVRPDADLPAPEPGPELSEVLSDMRDDERY
ncbi:MAG: sterol desaturase family protein [Acidimicrobiia bacterium]|nr:sterol desaturase family protein [Acidimicrobiia bacterium]